MKTLEPTVTACLVCDRVECQREVTQRQVIARHDAARSAALLRGDRFDYRPSLAEQCDQRYQDAKRDCEAHKVDWRVKYIALRDQHNALQTELADSAREVADALEHLNIADERKAVEAAAEKRRHAAVDAGAALLRAALHTQKHKMADDPPGSLAVIVLAEKLIAKHGVVCWQKHSTPDTFSVREGYRSSLSEHDSDCLGCKFIEAVRACRDGGHLVVEGA